MTHERVAGDPILEKISEPSTNTEAVLGTEAIAESEIARYEQSVKLLTLATRAARRDELDRKAAVWSNRFLCLWGFCLLRRYTLY